MQSALRKGQPGEYDLSSLDVAVGCLYNFIGSLLIEPPQRRSMLISKKVEFSASHVCRSPQLADADNERVYGAAANPLGHGHNYILEVSVEGEPDPVTGMILDLKLLKQILEDKV